MKHVVFAIMIIFSLSNMSWAGSLTLDEYEETEIGIGVFAYDDPDEILERSLRTGIAPVTFFMVHESSGLFLTDPLDVYPGLLHRGYLGVIHQDTWFSINGDFARHWGWTGIASEQAFLDYQARTSGSANIARPEPATWILMATGMLVLGYLRRRYALAGRK